MYFRAALAWKYTVSTIVALTFGNIDVDCFSTYSGVEVKWRLQLVRNPGSTWTFGKAIKLMYVFGQLFRQILSDKFISTLWITVELYQQIWTRCFH